MRAHELNTRLLEALGGNDVYWTEAERYDCLNEAARLLCLLKPEVLTRRVTVSVVADEVFLDLRQLAPDLLHLDQVVVGNVSTHPPVESQGILRHLHRATLLGLRSHQTWLLKQQTTPEHWLRFGLYWLITWPRAILAHTLTLVYRAAPATLVPTSPNTMLAISETYQGLIVELAAAIAQAKEGSGTVQESMQILQRVFGRERFPGLKQHRRPAA